MGRIRSPGDRWKDVRWRAINRMNVVLCWWSYGVDDFFLAASEGENRQ